MKTTLKKGDLSATTDTFGGELRSLMLNGHEYLWQADPAWWTGQAPVLFPIVGSLRGGEARSSQGICRMGRHGLVRKKEHALISVNDDSVTYETLSDEETRKHFPYDYRLRMSYTLLGNDTIETRFTVTNTGKVSLPFCCGGHPAFHVPAGGIDALDYSDFELKFEDRLSIKAPLLDRDGIFQTDKIFEPLTDSDTLPLKHELFDTDAIMLSHVPASRVTLRSSKSAHGVQVNFPGMDFLGIWSAPKNAPFVALEPWSGHSATDKEDGIFEHKEGMTILAPGETRSFAFTIRVF